MSTMRTTGSYGYNALCDVCGFKHKAAELKKRWDGLMVCNKDFELRHPMDFYTTRNDAHLLPWTRSDNNGIDVSPPYNTQNLRVVPSGEYRITPTNVYRRIVIGSSPDPNEVVRSAIAGIAISGNAISGSIT